MEGAQKLLLKRRRLTSGPSSLGVRKATPGDLFAIKEIADQHKQELGFVLRPALSRSIERGELIVAQDNARLVGFVEYHHRQDEQTTLYHIAVVPHYRRRGLGTALIKALRDEARDLGKACIRLKCPAGLPAGSFYEHLGFHSVGEEPGKNRLLTIFILTI
jgi:GNAT superfamily N-acetyltransferase